MKRGSSVDHAVITVELNEIKRPNELLTSWLADVTLPGGIEN